MLEGLSGLSDRLECDLSSKLLREIAEWKSVRMPPRTRTAQGVVVERKPARRRTVGAAGATVA